MTRIVCALALVLASCLQAEARDGFDKVRCDGDIAKALIGQRMSDEPVVAIEGRHKNLKLKDLGASDYDSISSITWSICGKELMLLEEKRTNIVRDALNVPPHSKINPVSEGRCKLNGKSIPGTVFAILREQAGQDELPADAAWRIDEKAGKFVKMPTDGMLCSRNGIVESGSQK